jgi:hypothetical protein
MFESRLILIEGIPGSGKTTTARFVNDWLQENGRSPALFLEGDWNHPADYESVARLNADEYVRLVSEYPDQENLFIQYGQMVNREWFIKYQQMRYEQGKCIPPALFDRLSEYEIYALPVKKFTSLLLDRWQAFASQAAREKVTYVFECCFLQNPVVNLLAHHNLPAEAIRKYIQSLADAVRPLNPNLIYLQPLDVRATLQQMRRERSREWADFNIWYTTEQKYGKAHGLHGYDGVIDFYAVRQSLELDLINSLPVPSLVLTDVSPWERRHQNIIQFIG